MTSSVASLALSLLSATLAFSICSGALPPVSNDDGGMTHLYFCFHEFFQGANQTSYVDASLHQFPNSTFGVIRVFDNAMTVGPAPTSQLLGRAQGTVVGTSLGVGAVMTSINFVFSAGEHEGSSLAILGRSSADRAVNEHAVVGGSGKFRMARGYALSKVLSQTDVSVVVEFNFYVSA